MHRMREFVFIFLVISLAWRSLHASAGKPSDPLAGIRTKTPGSVQADAVRDLIQRKVPARASAFHVTVDASLGPGNLDTFQIESDGLTVNITGTTGVAAAWGFYHYLNKYCACHISWAGDQLNIPSKLPKVQPALKVTSPNRFRYYQNVCTVSYSFAFWNWTRWEREIDWMAMNGINLPLAFNAQEAIWQRVYLKMGFTQDDLDTHFGGPAFLAWSRMGNMHGFGGPLTPSWHANQLQLQHQILKRMRNLGITPVLPAFAGHVPKTFKRLFPNASVSVGPAWGNFAKDPQYCCDLLLEPTDPLFKSIGKAFIEAMADEFNGTDHIYNGDTFNEMSPKQGDTKYLAQASKAVYDAIVEADPKGVWLMQDWLFQSGFWTQDRIKAYLQGVPKGRMIVLDLGSDTVPQYSLTKSFYGQPFIWCMLGNFGGNHGLYGKLDTVLERLFSARKFGGSTMVGTGITPEGINQNDVMYAFLYDLSWRSKPLASVSQWIANYSTARYGTPSLLAQQAWDILRVTVYNCTDSHSNHNQGPIVKTPQTSDILPYIWYDWTMVGKAWNLMLQAAPQLKHNHLFKYDLVDITRQVLQDLSYHIYLDFGDAYQSRNFNLTITTLDKLLDLILDLDTILSTDSRWLLGNWLEAAKAMGSTVQEKKWLEYNARNQITLWGPSGEIRDYANKHWAGLVKTFYYRRWELFAFQVEEALFTKTPFDPAHFQKMCFNLIEKPWTTETTTFTAKPIGDTFEVSQLLYAKYQEDLSFYAKQRTPISLKNVTSGDGLSYSSL